VQNIHGVQKKIKSFKGIFTQNPQTAKNRESLFLVMIIVLVGLSSFGLGRLSVLEDTKEPIRIGEIELNSLPAGAYLSLEKNKKDSQIEPEISGVVVGSKTGSKYHFPWCPGSNQMKEENKIYFDSVEDARKAGYTPAANCKGLK